MGDGDERRPAARSPIPLSGGLRQLSAQLLVAERFEFVNTPGQETYSWIVADRDRDSWADVEQYSYPLHVCLMPQALDAGKIN